MGKLITSFLLILLTISLYSKETLIFSTGEWAPYTSQKDPNGRLMQNIVTEAFKTENVDVLYKYYPWKRAYKVVLGMEVDGSLAWYKNSEREELFYYSTRPLANVKIVVFHLKSLDFKWDSFDDLRKYKIGGNLGYTSTQVLLDRNIEVEMVRSEEQNFKKLLLGRIDITPTSFFAGYYLINKLFSKEKAMLFTNHTKQVVPQNGLYFIVPKKNPKAKELMNMFNRGYNKLVKSGRYEEIIDEFISK
ncbi:MAG: transporter substrate-binding domain-containing protein [Campylobacteraceae bacterium]|nr:transporter substrate-binding domain-containing protein [Campylobacteraceae bacterium]